MHLNPLFCCLGFGTALRNFNKKLFYKWGCQGQDSSIDDFFKAYIGGGEL